MSTANSVITQLQSDLQFANETTGASDTTIHDAITTLASGFGGGKLEDFIPEEAFHVTGNCVYRFGNKGFDWFLNRYGDKITTENITSAERMFLYSEVESIPFDFNFTDSGGNISYMFSQCRKLRYVTPINPKHNTTAISCDSVFAYCSDLKEIGTLSNLFPTKINDMFIDCANMRYLPEFENLNLSYIQSNTSAQAYRLFTGCHSLREVPESLLRQIYMSITNYRYTHFYGMFTHCLTLNEIIGLNPNTGELTTNAFYQTFDNNSRVKEIIFATQEDSSPYSVNWKSQVIDLSVFVGYAETRYIDQITTGRNSGITTDKRVITDADYQKLKNDPDWFTTDVKYSRYNHDSAVNTINSLPDTSAYLATAGGTNTIKFTGQSGALTDGGAINTLTEAEIAVATAKGWTVTFV